MAVRHINGYAPCKRRIGSQLYRGTTSVSFGYARDHPLSRMFPERHSKPITYGFVCPDCDRLSAADTNLSSSKRLLVGLHSKWRDVSFFGYILDGAIRAIDLL